MLVNKPSNSLNSTHPEHRSWNRRRIRGLRVGIFVGSSVFVFGRRFSVLELSFALPSKHSWECDFVVGVDLLCGGFIVGILMDVALAVGFGARGSLDKPWSGLSSYGLGMVRVSSMVIVGVFVADVVVVALGVIEHSVFRGHHFQHYYYVGLTVLQRTIHRFRHLRISHYSRYGSLWDNTRLLSLGSWIGRWRNIRRHIGELLWVLQYSNLQ
ncbi:hypothetical protein F8M41_001539 [Gigaspora margarita]|uniref:Uncharacterized protein n=1 Tax=Gigaspora margarita TaxID=4874 RepID=A0A8H4ESP4_GIGMA|nr:hypothetical protein F8M41_001539 [Gigaspora margarita]